MDIIRFCYDIMGDAWDILFDEFVIFETIGGTGVTFGALSIVLIVIFYVIYKVVGS